MKYDTTRHCVLLGVRELCAYTCASGDLSAGTPPEWDFAGEGAAGGALHKLLTARAADELTGGESLQTEVSLELPVRDGGIDYLISGRADALLETGGIPTVIEIKTVTEPMLRQPPPAAYTSQLCIYAFMLCRLRDLARINTRLTCAVPDGGKIRRTERVYTADELEFSLRALLAVLRDRAAEEIRRVTVTVPAAASLTFPHPSLRAGQKQLIASVCSAVRRERRLFAQAPTGIGKTVSVLYGAVRAWGDGGFRRIFYLTAKASTRREAYAAAGRIYSAGAGLRTAVLSAKEHMCPRAEARDGDGFLCDPDSCPLAKGYFDRRDEAQKWLLDNYHGYPSGAFMQAGAKYSVCPYELSLDMSEYCDIVICDYNYAFDPAVKLRRYFADDVPRGDCVFLIDEAHNLTERARDIYSATLTGDDVAALRRFTSGSPKTDEALERLAAALDAQKELCREDMLTDEDGNESGYYFSRNPVPGLDEAVDAAQAACEIFFFAHRTDRAAAVAAAAFMRLCRKWSEAAGAYSSCFRTYIEVVAGRVSVKLYCLDPSERLDEALDAARAAVFFSATLTPSDYFADVLGGGRDSRSLSLPSPFPRANLFISALTGISTRFEDRKKSVAGIVRAIAVTASAKAGNYIVYFPSYGYLDSVVPVFTAKYPRVSVSVQRRGMSRAERDEFLSFFRADEGRLRIGFCVLGGSFSEGVDLPGSRLIGVMVVGVGLPGLSAERNIIRDYYETKIERGYDYAYTYPGMNSVLQAAGRVIRRDDDRGVVVLIDDRYATPQYRGLMPPHWEGIHLCGDGEELAAGLHDFWASG